MIAHWLTDSGTDGDTIEPSTVAREGLLTLRLSGDADDELDAIIEEQGYQTRVRSSLVEGCEEECRFDLAAYFVIDGELTVDVPTSGGRRMRLTLAPGDLIGLPPGAAHVRRGQCEFVLLATGGPS